jgi:hypothetical protein
VGKKMPNADTPHSVLAGKVRGPLGVLLVLITASTGSRCLEQTHSNSIQAADYALAQSAVTRAHGRISHELPIINAVAADLSTRQLALRKRAVREI